MPQFFKQKLLRVTWNNFFNFDVYFKASSIYLYKNFSRDEQRNFARGFLIQQCCHAMSWKDFYRIKTSERTIQHGRCYLRRELPKTSSNTRINGHRAGTQERKVLRGNTVWGAEEKGGTGCKWMVVLWVSPSAFHGAANNLASIHLRHGGRETMGKKIENAARRTRNQGAKNKGKNSIGMRVSLFSSLFLFFSMGWEFEFIFVKNFPREGKRQWSMVDSKWQGINVNFFIVYFFPNYFY